MKTVSFYTQCLPSYERSLLRGEWPLPFLGPLKYNLDIGLDPSMSSSGVCLILRTGDTVVNCLTKNHKTTPGVPTPLRLGSLVEVMHQLIDEILMDVPGGKIQITLLSEIPPVAMSSSGWLFALCQLLWLGFGPDNELFQELKQRGFQITFSQFGIGVPQLKNIYLHWAKGFGLTPTFREISKQKSLVVKIVGQVIEQTSIRPLLPKRFNNDVAEGIALALCAGGCSKINGYTFDAQTMKSPYLIVPSELLHGLMTNKKVNKQNQRMGWVYRPLEYSFGWVSA